MNSSSESESDKRLADAEKKLAQLQSYFADFVHHVAHDVQSPVKKILSFSDLLTSKIKNQADDSYKEYIRRIDNNALTLGRLVNQLKDYSSFVYASGRKELVDLNVVLAELKDELALKISEVSPTWHVDDMPSISGIPAHVKRLWHNLLINALTYRSSDRPLEIFIRMKKEPDHWEFSVADNGKGIPDFLTERIFQVFPNAGTQEGPPTGIGLAICKAIVENHGGKIRVKSSAGLGSTFYISWPI